jgi:integral membrane sensor domain MASE1
VGLQNLDGNRRTKPLAPVHLTKPALAYLLYKLELTHWDDFDLVQDSLVILLNVAFTVNVLLATVGVIALTMRVASSHTTKWLQLLWYRCFEGLVAVR